MSGLETAIRTALSNSDRDNPEVRARIYQSARQALEAGLRKQDITEREAVARHRHRLEATIHMIEAEERERLHPRTAPPEVPVPPVAEIPLPATHGERFADDAPQVGGETRAYSQARAADDESSLDDVHAGTSDHLGAAPQADEGFAAESPAAARMNFRPEGAAKRRKPRKFFSRLLVWCVLIAFIGMGAWWTYTSGLFLTAAERDTGVANPPASTEPEDFDGTDEDAANSGPPADQTVAIDPQNSFSAEWIEVFKPSEAAKIESGARARTENVAENDGPAVRLISESNGADGNIAIAVPPDVLQQLAGKSSTIAITLQSTSDEPTQITVECDFQTLGNCARHRFSITREKSDALLQVTFDRSMAPNAAGKLLINSDVDGKARGINLYAVRVLPGQ
ncbi:regulator [Rhizobium sp. P32RR-XVIII]|uniref:regulator n=1 Tax=Rhizobium sp. P32RR-XVIII TaxID=2726738 RepID=UPI001456C59D|nr:regulator [Rhizobium sp. P32RR-XVIII]NLS02185.1 regulator [Rhizobium sp. P32RR-XVIII]